MKATRSAVVVCGLVLTVLVAACALGPAKPVESMRSGGEAQAPALLSAGDVSLGAASTGAGGDRMIVRTAQLGLVVQDTEDAARRIKDIVARVGGWVADTKLWREEEQLRGSISVRVPSESLDDVLEQFRALAVRVENENGSSQDVTQEYTDLSSQLRNLEATEGELLELLRTVRERTGKAEDILAVHRELTNIRGQIEQLKGRMQYLERTSEMALVTVELIPDVLARPIAVAGWRPSATVASALRALLQALRFLVNAGIWIVLYVVPVAVIVLIPFVAVWFVWRGRRRRKSSTPRQ